MENRSAGFSMLLSDFGTNTDLPPIVSAYICY